MDNKTIVVVVVLVLIAGVLIGEMSSATGYGILDTMAKILGGKGKPGRVTTANCTVVPNPASLGSTVTLSGSGFKPYGSGGYAITDAGGTYMGFMVFDSKGSFSIPLQPFWPGTSNVYVAGNTKPQVSAKCSFEIIG